MEKPTERRAQSVQGNEEIHKHNVVKYDKNE
jgi:hypothetical protein